MREHGLERYLSPHQAAAWVVYRDIQFAKLCSDPDLYHAQKFWPTQPKHGDEAELARALVEGQIVAQGRVKGDSAYASIPAIDWQRMRIAPQDPRKEHRPYDEIRIERHELLQLFPSLRAGGKGGRPKTIDEVHIHELAKVYAGMSLQQTADNVRADYEKTRPRISESSVKRVLRELQSKGVQNSP